MSEKSFPDLESTGREKLALTRFIRRKAGYRSVWILCNLSLRDKVQCQQSKKGIFVCYEVKSCREDVFSGNGLNFIGEKNYIVTTMQCYKEILEDYRNGTLDEHVKKMNGKKRSYGILVAMPSGADPYEEMKNPTLLESECKWELKTMIQCYECYREKSMTELLFCMLRSGKN